MNARLRAAIASRIALAMLGAFFISAFAGCKAGAKPAPPAPTSCEALMPRIRAVATAYDATAGLLADHAMPVLLASCLDDHWPADLRECIAKESADAIAHEHACEKLVPRELALRVAKRLGVPADSLPQAATSPTTIAP